MELLQQAQCGVTRFLRLKSIRRIGPRAEDAREDGETGRVEVEVK